MKMKVIQLGCISHSFFSEQLRKTMGWGITHDWYAYTAFALKKIHPELEIECWTQERRWKKERNLKFENIKFRIFPGSFYLRYGMEISCSMINALNEEIEKCGKENKKVILHFHEHHLWQSCFLLLFLKKRKNVEIVCQHHGGRGPFKSLKKYKKLFFAIPFLTLNQIAENLAFKKVDLFYSLSDEETNYLKKISPSSKIKFQTMGIEDKYFKSILKKEARRKLKLENDKRYLLFIGRIKATKGLSYLIEAMKKINAELLLIGGGPDEKRYKKYAEKKGIRNVKFLGTLYNDDKLVYLSACDVFVLPSFTEGAPVVLMEAIARNLPVIATNVGGIPKMIENNREGIIINPYSIEEIVKSAGEILKWKKKNIRKYAEKYLWKNIAKKTYNDYKNL